MKQGIPKLIGASMLVLMILSSLIAAPAHGQASFNCNGAVADQQMICSPSMPVWATLNAGAQGNYPGGSEIFTVFVVDSAQNPSENVSVHDATLTAPFGSNFGIGLPTLLVPGSSVLLTIALEIPTNYSQRSFNANLVVNANILTAGSNTSARLTGTAVVNVFALTGQTSSQPTQGTISTTLFAAGVAIPSIIVILLLVLLVRNRGSPKS